MSIKKTLNVYYARVPNMGDLLNKLIIEELFGYNVSQHTYLTGEISAIGSGLGQFTLHGNILAQYIQKIVGLLYPNVTIWGTGFISYRDVDTPFYRKNIKFTAIRGELSKRRAEKILRHEISVPLGDAGILSSYLLKETVNKRFKVGIIAHFKEQDEPIFNTLLNNYSDSTFINVKQSPETVIRQIAECECIISSSLHGLIIADSLNIPNIHIVVSNKLLGDGFKFDDYYSAYGIEHPHINLNKENIPTLKWIKENYRITSEMVNQMKKNMIDAFPYKNEDALIYSLK